MVMPKSVVVVLNLEAGDGYRVDHRDPLRTVGDVDRCIQVVHEDAHDLAETQRDDGQVVAAQLQASGAPRSARRCRRPGAERQDPRTAGAGRNADWQEQCPEIGADGVEGDVAEVEQAGEADHDVQAERREGIEDREVEDAHPGLATHAGNERQRDQGDDDQRQPESREKRDSAICSCAVSCLLAEQSRRPEHQHENEHDEGEDVLVVATEETARKIADVAGAEGLDQAEQHASGHCPARLPMPPRTAAVKAFRPSMKPIW